MMAASDQPYSMQLTELLQGLTEQPVVAGVSVSGLSLDSRRLNPGDVFIALSGTQQHGADYISAAVAAGASAIIYAADYRLQLPKLSIPIISVERLNEKVGQIAHRFYQAPSTAVRVIGITGTNGKTSTAWFLAQALQRENRPVGFIGTLGSGLFGSLQETANTTPDVISIHRSLAEFRQAGADYAVMEVSSHALQQQRVAAVEFYAAIFTNLSRDHLDYHGTMRSYRASKQRLFTDYVAEFHIINADDDHGRDLIRLSTKPVYRYTSECVIANDDQHTVSAALLNSGDGLLTFELNSPWGRATVRTHLIGEFNVCNLLAVISVLGLSGMSMQDIVKHIESLHSVPGRMQAFVRRGAARVVVDYAHTPDALEKVLQSLRKQLSGRLYCVFGCGGDRDGGKRSQMGRIAEQYADVIILTNDNPRTESPLQIIDDIQRGIEDHGKVHIELDRSKAIAYAIKLANHDDCVLVAGKGHEDYQIIGERKTEFDDRLWVQRLLESEGD